MASRSEIIEGFASASLVAVLVRALQAMDPGLLPRGTVAPDPMKGARVDATAKRTLVDAIHAGHGPGPLLAVGQFIDLAEGPAILTVLSRAAEPGVLIEKWLRLERYGHATNRTDIKLDGDTAIDSRRLATSGAPTAGENALIAGFLFAICGLAGARGLRLELGAQILEKGTLASVSLPADDDLAHFRISWTHWQKPKRPDLPPATGSGRDATSKRLKVVFASDIGRSWQVSDTARLLAKSVRALQRDLAASGRSFSSVLREARIDEASRLLCDPSAPLADIGYCCGYADQPHFQRDFRRVANMTPGEYRRIGIG